MTIEDVLTVVRYDEFIGDKAAIISSVSPFDEANEHPEILMWVNEKNRHRLNQLKFGTVICSSLSDIEPKEGCNYILTEKPRLLFTEILDAFFKKQRPQGIAPSVHIAPTAKIGEGVYIGHNVIIEDNCVIGNDTIINHNTTILYDTIIGNNVIIGANNTIGGVGFGYEKDLEGNYIQIPHIGNVVIENGVEIGNNTCIDRAVLGSTLIKENAKIDNLVHIAHGVIVGKNALVIANAMVAGSTVLGDNVWVAPSASVLNKLVVEDNAFIGMGAVVIKNVAASDVIVGNPGKSIRKA